MVQKFWENIRTTSTKKVTVVLISQYCMYVRSKIRKFLGQIFFIDHLEKQKGGKLCHPSYVMNSETFFYCQMYVKKTALFYSSITCLQLTHAWCTTPRTTDPMRFPNNLTNWRYFVLQLNEYETDMYFLPNFQCRTMLIHAFCKICEPEIVLKECKSKQKQFQVNISYKTRE